MITSSQFFLHQLVKQSRIFGGAPAIHAVGAVGAQVVRAVYQHDRSVGIGGELSLDKGHVFDKFFAVASADKGLETEKMVGTKMEF